MEEALPFMTVATAREISSTVSWIREERALWGYLPRDIGRLRFDEDFAPLRERLEQLLPENAERDSHGKDSPYDKG
jgi:hypothetical protein